MQESLPVKTYVISNIVSKFILTTFNMKLIFFSLLTLFILKNPVNTLSRNTKIEAFQDSVPTALLHRWQVTHMLVAGKKIPADTQMKAGYLSFKKDFSYESTLAPGPVEKGTFSYNEKTKIIKFYVDGPPREVKVMKITATELYLDLMFDNTSGNGVVLKRI